MRTKWIIICLSIFLIVGGGFIGWKALSIPKDDIGIKEGPPLPKGTTQPQLIVSGRDAILLAPDGSLYRWGGKSTSLKTPIRVKPELRFRHIAADQNAVIGILEDGTIWGWGKKSRVIPYDRNLASQEHRQLFADTGFQKLSMGNSHAIALKEDGTIWAWGSNMHGGLGQGIPPGTEMPSLESSDVPLQIGTDTDWVSIHTAYNASYAIKQDGTIWRWGKLIPSPRISKNPTVNILSNKLPEEAPRDYSRPERLTDAKGWKHVVLLSEAALLLHEDGSLWIDGNPTPIQFWLSINSQGNDSNGLARIGKETDWTRMIASENHILAQQKDGSWWGMGLNIFNPLALLLEDGQINVPPPSIGHWKKLPDSFNPWAIGLGHQTTLVLTHDGRLWSSGSIIGAKRKDPLWNHFASWINRTAKNTILPPRMPKHHSGFHHIWTWQSEKPSNANSH